MLFRDVTLQRDLDDDKRVRKGALVVLEGREEDEEMVCGSVGHELQVVGRVLVVRSHVERHHPLQEHLGRRVVREQGVPVDVVQLALRGMRAPRNMSRQGGSIEAQQRVEPLLHRVRLSIPDGLFKLDLGQRPGHAHFLPGGVGRYRHGGVFPDDGSRLFSELLDQLDGQTSTGSFVSIDSGGHEHQVRSEQFSNERKRDGCGLVDDDELGLTQDVRVLRLDVLYTEASRSDRLNR